MQQLLILMSLGYLCGSFPSGKLLGKLRGIDIQKHGSGNIGFANAVRVLGWRFGTIVLVLDVAKSFVPTLIATHFLGQTGQLAVGTAAILGHLYPVWLRFKGGKGIATGLGVLLAIEPLIGLVGLATYCIVFGIKRVSGLASLIGVWTLPFSALVIDRSLVLYCLVLACLGTLTHWDYIPFIRQKERK